MGKAVVEVFRFFLSQVYFARYSWRARGINGSSKESNTGPVEGKQSAHVETFTGFVLGSTSSRCSGNEPALLSGGAKTGLEKTTEIEPRFVRVTKNLERHEFYNFMESLGK